MLPNIRSILIGVAAMVLAAGAYGPASATTLLGQSIEVCTNTDFPSGAASADSANCIDSPAFIHTTVTVTDPDIEFPMTAARQVDLGADTRSGFW